MAQLVLVVGGWATLILASLVDSQSAILLPTKALTIVYEEH
jgi:hypothetical protein